MTYTATYSPEDNKLRLYASARLDSETYTRVKAAGFKWAPKQGLFVAPMWTPEREDLLLEMAGDIGDEDTSLVDRAESRAERFTDYSERRADDAERAQAAVHAIADNIPFGQPILVGHHSERRARKDAEKIQNGMRKTVQLWKTARYWTERAAGAIRAAKYKERPDVRARRIKGIESDLRRSIASYTPAKNCPMILQQRWNSAPDDPKIPHVWVGHSRGGRWVPKEDLPAIEARAARWVEHYENRLAYERAMLAESGGTVADRNRPEVGGAIRCWVGLVEVKKVNKVSVSVSRNWGNGGPDFLQTIKLEDIKQVFTREQWERMKNPPEPEPSQPAAAPLDESVTVSQPDAAVEPERERRARTLPSHTELAAMHRAATAPVQIVTAPQLYPTPKELARRMAEEAGGVLMAGLRVLEPSAGTGNLVRAIHGAVTGANCVRIVAVEIHPGLVASLESQRSRTVWANEDNFGIVSGDFLELEPPTLGLFDRILMNPPFAEAADIAHIQHARRFLKPDGVLVAICAAGPRQERVLRPLVEECGGVWSQLPRDTFADCGTRVNTVLLTLTAASAPAEEEEKEEEEGAAPETATPEPPVAAASGATSQLMLF